MPNITGNAKLQDVTIGAGANVSRTVTWNEYQDALGIIFYGPAALDAIDFTIEVCDDEDAGSPVWRTFMTGTPPTAVSPPGALESFVLFELPLARAWRIKAASNIGGTPRTWNVSKQF